MARRIGEILVGAGACTEAAVREALQNQVIFGGRLGTNLLELRAVTEEALGHALGERYHVPSLSGEIKLDPRALALLKPDIADRYDVIPYFLADRRLAILVCDPTDLDVLDAAAFASGKQVHPIVVPEARIWALLRTAYGIERQLRGIDVEWTRLEVRDEGRPQGATSPRESTFGAGDLIPEGEFDAIYGAGPGDRTRAAAAPPSAAPPPPPAGGRAAGASARSAPRPGTPPRPDAAPPPAPDDDPILELEDLLEESPLPDASPLSGDLPELADEAFRALGKPLASGAARIAERLAGAPGHAPPARFVAPAPEPEPSPLSFADAVRFLEGVEERDAIARTLLRYARSKFRRAVLLTIQHGFANGWVGLGEKLSAQAVRRIRIPLGTPGIVDTVVTTQAHYLGPIPKTEANVRLLKQLGGGVPGNAFLVPMLARGRVVNVFYADAGRGALVDAGDAGELLILATRIAQSYDALLRRAG